jgi:hypothetical protein
MNSGVRQRLNKPLQTAFSRRLASPGPLDPVSRSSRLTGSDCDVPKSQSGQELPFDFLPDSGHWAATHRKAQPESVRQHRKINADSFTGSLRGIDSGIVTPLDYRFRQRLSDRPVFRARLKLRACIERCNAVSFVKANIQDEFDRLAPASPARTLPNGNHRKADTDTSRTACPEFHLTRDRA